MSIRVDPRMFISKASMELLLWRGSRFPAKSDAHTHETRPYRDHVGRRNGTTFSNLEHRLLVLM